MKYLAFVRAALLALALSGCGSEPSSVSSPAIPPPTPAPPPVPPQMAIIEVEKKAEIERQLRLNTETRLAEQESARAEWQTRALLAVTAAVVLLIIGTILGTRARHDAQK